jgi:hypothetical protein
MASWTAAAMAVTTMVTVSPQATATVDGLGGQPGPAAIRTTRGAATVPATTPASPGCASFLPTEP